MNIKLILPTFYDEKEKLVKIKKSFVPNLTLRYLAAMVPKHHTVSVLEESVENIDFDEKIDLIGITVHTVNAFRAYEIAKEFRKRNVKVVLGGIHVTSIPEEAMQHADAIVLGEAEDAWPQLLQDLENNKLQRRYHIPRRESLHGLPFPRLDLIDNTKYLILPFEKYPMIPIQTSRGCPHNCEFCTVTKFWGNKVRYRPIEDIVEEIKRINCKTFFFMDDNIVSNYARAESLFKALIPLKIKYVCQMDVPIYKKPELIKLAAKSGCFVSYIGFESINKENLQEMHKNFNNPEEYEKVFKVFKQNGINIYSSFIFGFDKDEPRLVNKTIDFLIKQKNPLCACYPLCPFPGTDLYERFKLQNRLIDDIFWLKRNVLGNSFGIKYQNIHPSGVSLSSMAMKQFYSFPSILKRLNFGDKNWLFMLVSNLVMHRRVNKSIAYVM